MYDNILIHIPKINYLMLSHLTLEFVQYFGLSSDRCHIVVLYQNRSGPKADLPVKRKNMLIAKNKLFGSRVIHFWTRIWSGRDDGLRVVTEVWNDDNTSNCDGYKILGSNGETSIYGSSNQFKINNYKRIYKTKWQLSLFQIQNILLSEFGHKLHRILIKASLFSTNQIIQIL